MEESLVREPPTERDEILVLDDPAFNPANVAIVTGAASGIGRATAVALAANGLTVVGLDVDPKGGEQTRAIAEGLGGKVEFIDCDLCSDEQVRAAVEEAAGLGRLRYLVNIAGVQHIDFIEDFPMDVFDKMQRIMLRAPVLLTKLCIPHFKANPDGVGVVGNMASIHAHVCTVAKVSYNIAKFAMRALAQSIAAEGGGKIRAFTVSTGFVATPLALGQIPAQAAKRGISPEEVVREVMCGHSRLKELMKPIEVANLFVFGLSRFARFLIGGDLLFDGGLVLTYGD